jgi:hypothetical protein
VGVADLADGVGACGEPFIAEVEAGEVWEVWAVWAVWAEGAVGAVGAVLGRTEVDLCGWSIGELDLLLLTLSALDASRCAAYSMRLRSVVELGAVVGRGYAMMLLTLSATRVPPLTWKSSRSLIRIGLTGRRCAREVYNSIVV